MICVGLDLATNSAACWGRPNEIPQFRRWYLEGSPPERGLMFLHAFRALLDSIKCDHRGDEIFVYIEEPLEPRIMVKIGTHKSATIMLPGLVYLAQVVCSSRKVESFLVARQDALEHFTGRRMYRRQKPAKKLTADLFTGVTSRKRTTQKLKPLIIQDPAKHACMQRCKQLRWPAETFDESDAAAIWDYGSAQHSKASQIARRFSEQPLRIG